MYGYRFTAPLLALTLCALSGCVSLSQLSQLPEGTEVREIAKADAGKPFAVTAGGTFAAISKDAIELITPDGRIVNIAQGSATALCFSPSGDKVAAALPAEKGTILRLFDREGKVLGERAVPERVTSMAWRSESELLVAALIIKKFSFGSQLDSILYRWDGATAPVATTLDTVTVRPHVAKLPEETLYKTFNMALSPYGDEIAYTLLKDPPLFTPYLRIAIRHLDSGAEREIGKTSVGSGGPLYTPDGESLVVGDTQAMTRRLSIPEGREMNAWPSAGSYPALSPSGSYIYLEGRVYQDGRNVATFPTRARGAFLPDGSGLAISYDGKLYQVSGPRDRQAPPLPSDMQRLLQLRRLRSMGLITEKEYRGQKVKESAR